MRLAITPGAESAKQVSYSVFLTIADCYSQLLLCRHAQISEKFGQMMD